jgi:UDP-N-acetylglucosamine:LPS N-acetylglucosamine transferase
MGEGHNATGRALEETLRREWPDVQVRWLDTLRVMGRGVGPVFRRIYVSNVEQTPWLYELFYSALWRIPWFARAAKRFVAEWAGRRLRRPVREFAPDLVLSTYPLGTGGLEWLRQRGDLSAPIGAWVSDFAPHPFWVYGDVDRTVVMHDVAVSEAQRCVPAATVSVSVPPVLERFRPAPRAEARRSLELAEDAFVAVISCGSLGFGSVPDAAAELLAADDRVVVVAVCGHNERLRAQVAAVAPAERRLIVLGWTDRIPELLAACDVLVTNAGGATSLEALAMQRAVLMYQPIAAHGRANAELMAEAGLAELCPTKGSLVGTVRELLAHPERVAEMESRARAHTMTSSGLDEQLHALVRTENDRGQRLRAQDSLFLRVHSPEVPQQIGAVLMLDPKPDGSCATVDDAVYLASATPGLGNRIRYRGRWRKTLLIHDFNDSSAQLTSTVDIGAEVTAVGERQALDDAMAEFFSVPLDPTREAARARLVTGLAGHRSAFLLSAHHVFSDGIGVTGSLVAQANEHPWPEQTFPLPDSTPQLDRKIRTGLVALARAGRAEPTAVNRRISSTSRKYARASISQRDVREVAEAQDTSMTQLLLALFGAAWHDVLGGDTVRVMAPRTTRSADTFRATGNYTGAATIDLPVGDLPFVERIRRTANALRAQVDSGAPEAAQFVVWLIGALPPWLHRRIARNFYSDRWFALIVSVLPGVRARVVLRGSLVESVYAVLPLAPGTAMSVGFMTWGEHVTMCVCSDPEGAADAEALCAAFSESFERVLEAGR